MTSEIGHAAVVDAMLAAGTDAGLRGDDGATALMQASWHGHHGIVKALLAKGSPLDVGLKDGTLPLPMAA